MSDLADFEDREYEEQERDDEDSRADPADSYVTVEISGLSVFTHHGVTQAEQDAGQRLIFDISLDVEDCSATVTDRLEDTIDYGAVCDAVIYAATERSYRTLERLCAALADMLVDRFSASGVTVRATKPEPPLPAAVDEVSVEVSR
jgi:7,8-dihydroneopterin aldolase/epimerase/oxygenase